MTFKDLIPFGRKNVPVRRDEEHPLLSLRHEMDRIFDDFFRGFPAMASFSDRTEAFDPRLDVTETDKELRIKAELPGIDEKDVEVGVTHDTLTIRGEKKEEQEENNGTYYRMERSFGSFSRSIPLPREVDQEKVSATFKRGILTITLPKSVRAEERSKKIPVRTD